MAGDDLSEKSYHLLSEQLKENRVDSPDSVRSDGSSLVSLPRKTAIRPPPRPGMERLKARHHRAGQQPSDSSNPVAAMAQKMNQDRSKMEQEFTDTACEANETLRHMAKLMSLRGENYRTTWVVDAMKSTENADSPEIDRYNKVYQQVSSAKMQEAEVENVQDDSNLLPDRPKNTFNNMKVKSLRDKLQDMNKKAQTCLDRIESAKRELDDMSILSSKVTVNDDDPSVLRMKLLLTDDYLQPEALEFLKSPRQQSKPKSVAEDSDVSDEEPTTRNTKTPAFLTDEADRANMEIPFVPQMPPGKTSFPN